MTMPAPPAPDGGQPAAPPAQAPPAQAPAPPPAPAPQGQPPAVPAAPPVPQWTPPPAVPPVPQPPPVAEDDGSRDISRLPQWVQKEIQDLRKENADRRVAARTATVAQHAFAAAPTLGVNGHALLGSIPFQQAAAELDPQAPDFNTRLAAKVTEILAANPWMAQQAAPPAPGVSGGEFTGTPGSPAPITEEQLNSMTPDQIDKAFRDGRLQHLM